MQWKGKKIRVVLFGNYDLILKIFGISGAQSVYPCLWCEATKSPISKPPSAQHEILKSSLTNRPRDHRRYKLHGSGTKKVKAYNNVVYSPLLGLQNARVAPPYLHILLRTVHGHHDMLEQECHVLDENIPDCTAEGIGRAHGRNTPFWPVCESKHQKERERISAKREQVV